MKKKEEKTAGKTAIKTDDIVAAYRILNSPKSQDRDGVRLSALDTKDIFTVIRAANALKPVAVAFDDFQRDARERLKPDGWDERVAKFSDASEDEKKAINDEAMDFSRRVNECVASELEKVKEVDSFEHLSEEAFGALVKDNGHILDLPAILLLQQVIA